MKTAKQFLKDKNISDYNGKISKLLNEYLNNSDIHRWEFYRDDCKMWQWRKFKVNKVIAVSSESFFSKQACINNARHKGFIGTGTSQIIQ